MVSNTNASKSVHTVKALKQTEVLTVKQIQAIMQCGREKAYELVHSGRFPVKYLGTKDFRIPTDGFFSWLSTSDLPGNCKEN
jgi:hypothetical protein